MRFGVLKSLLLILLIAIVHGMKSNNVPVSENFSSLYFLHLPGQTPLTISTGVTREITASSECTGIGTITVNAGTLVIRASCIISAGLVLQNSGRIEVYPGITFKATRADVRSSSVGLIRGTLNVPILVVESSGTMELAQGSTASGLTTLSILSQGKFISYNHNLQLGTLTVNSASYLCQNRCVVRATNAALTSSNFLANAVSNAHQDCASQHSTAIVSGGNHAGCSGQNSCCLTSVLRPIGSVTNPRNVGYKGGTCTDDGAGLGGGSWELRFDVFSTLSGVNNIQANGGAPNTSKTSIGGGGSGGSILLTMLCNVVNENAFRLQVNGGNAITSSTQPAFGGSGGRIGILCSAGENEYRDLSQIYTAHGGLNAGTTGWGAVGTISLPQMFGGSKSWDVVHIYERVTNYNQVPVPYFPATFIGLIASDNPKIFLTYRTETESDIFFYSDEVIPYTFPIIEHTTDRTALGAVVNGSPAKLTLGQTPYYTRPPKPKTPPQPGECLNYYKGTMMRY